MKIKNERKNRYNWLREISAIEESKIEYKDRIDEVVNWKPKELISHMMQIKIQAYRVACEITYLTASRISEICMLKLKDIQYETTVNGDDIFWFTIQTEKRRDEDTIKKIPVSKNNNPEFIDMLKDIADFYVKRTETHGPMDYFIEDPDFKEVTVKMKLVKRDQNGKSIKDENGNKVYEIVQRKYLDNLLRGRIYKIAVKQGGFNPHLLRHARLTYIAKNPKYKE
ncbi:MAG: hypothetical protein ACP5M8_08115, partial [Caldisphaera sp.]